MFPINTMQLPVLCIFDPRNGIKVGAQKFPRFSCARCEDPDQPAYLGSPIKDLAGRTKKPRDPKKITKSTMKTPIRLSGYTCCS